MCWDDYETNGLFEYRCEEPGPDAMITGKDGAGDSSPGDGSGIGGDKSHVLGVVGSIGSPVDNSAGAAAALDSKIVDQQQQANHPVSSLSFTSAPPAGAFRPNPVKLYPSGVISAAADAAKSGLLWGQPKILKSDSAVTATAATTSSSSSSSSTTVHTTGALSSEKTPLSSTSTVSLAATAASATSNSAVSVSAASVSAAAATAWGSSQVSCLLIFDCLFLLLSFLYSSISKY